MLAEKIDLYKYYGLKRPEGGAGYLYSYIPSPMPCYPGRLRPAMLVLGGGGYAYVSERETECVALQFLAKGFCAFTLDYSVAPVRYPAQLNEAAMAMAYIRENAGKFGTDAAHVAVIGFSAGGHLAAMAGNIWNEEDIAEKLNKPASLFRPDAAVLCYPVISSGEKSHGGSFNNLCGEDAALKERLSVEKRVTPESCPAFIWTTADDGAVPSENSLLMAAAYKKQGVPFELHIFESGVHGLSIATEETGYVNVPVQQWLPMCLTWLKNRGFALRDEKQS